MTLFLSQIFRMSLWGSALAAVILLIKRLAGERLSAVFHYAVWGVLLLRLILPFSPSYVRPIAVESSEQPPFTSEAEETILQSIHTISKAPEISVFSVGDTPSSTVPTEKATRNPSRSSGLAERLPKILTFVYLLGCAIYAGTILLALVHYRKELLPDEKPPVLLALFEEERARINAPKRTRMQVSVSESPNAAGVLFPRVTIPLALTVDFSESDLRAVFRHELTHIRYGDTLLRVVMVILQGIYWFNPFLWYAFACIRRDGEYACDARVLRGRSPDEQLAYGAALLNVAELYAPKTSFLHNSFSVRPLRRRIEKIIAYRPIQWWVKLASVPLILLCLMIGIAVSAQGIDVLTMDIPDEEHDRTWQWSLKYPILAELPEEDMALYAVDAGFLVETDPYNDWVYSGRIALRQGEDVQICKWKQTYEDGWPAIAAGDYDHDGNQEYAFDDYNTATFVGERDGTLRIAKRDKDGIWNGDTTLGGYAVQEAVSQQFTASDIVNGALTFSLNGNDYQITLPEDLREKRLLRLEVLPYVKFHSKEDDLSVSVAIGAYFDKYPVFAGYVTAPITYSHDTLTVGAASFSGSFSRDYPENWLKLYDEGTGLTLGLPPHWKGNFINLGPHNEYDDPCLFELYEIYNYNLPPWEGYLHYGYLLTFYWDQKPHEDFFTFLGYHNGDGYGYQYPRGVEYNDRDPEARGHYQPLNMDEYEIVSRFVVANHLSVKQRLDYWQLMI